MKTVDHCGIFLQIWTSFCFEQHAGELSSARGQCQGQNLYGDHGVVLSEKQAAFDYRHEKLTFTCIFKIQVKI